MPQVEVALDAVEPRGADPAEHDVARRLQETLTLHHPLTVTTESAATGVSLQHRSLGFLDLEEQRVARVAAEEQRDPAPRADTADADDLPAEVDQAVALDQAPAVGLQGAAVHADAVLQPASHLLDLACREQVAQRDDHRRDRS